MNVMFHEVETCCFLPNNFYCPVIGMEISPISHVYHLFTRVGPVLLKKKIN